MSPAKALDYKSPLATKKHSTPRLLDKSHELIELLARKSPHELERLMSISPELAELNHERYQNFDFPFTPKNSRPSVLAFGGEAYTGLSPADFSERDFTHAQKSLRIISGLYGVLRPLDLMQPYRLSMGTDLPNSRGENLYRYWRDDITKLLKVDLEESPGPKVLVNLASNEYFSALNAKEIDAPIVAPVFLDSVRGGQLRVMTFFAKRARGMMTSWIIRNRIKSVRALKQFNGNGYEFAPDRSTNSKLVFTRHI